MTGFHNLVVYHRMEFQCAFLILYPCPFDKTLCGTHDVNNTMNTLFDSQGTCAYSRVTKRATRFITPGCSAEQRMRVSLLSRRREGTFTSFEIQIWLPDFILAINSIRIFCTWPNRAEVTHYIGSDFLFINWQAVKHSESKLGMHANEARQGWE